MSVPLRLLGLAAAAVMVVAGCFSTGDLLVDRPWTLAELRGAPPVDPEGIVGVSFGTDGRYTVHTGCRSGGGTYHLDGNRILLDSEDLQPVPCPDAMQVQDQVMAGVVEGRPRFEIDTRTGDLRLTSEAGEVLVFTAP